MASSSYIPQGTVEPVEMLEGITRRTLGITNSQMLVEITLKQDAQVPMHSHPNEQVGYVISGQFEMTINGQQRLCKAGDAYQIPGDVEHMGRAASDCVVIDCFTPPREDYR